MAAGETKLEDMLDNVALKHSKKKYVNILLLGETGVGKSTFINAFYNYIRWGKLEIAQQRFATLIPVKFEIFDHNYKSRTVSLGVDNNENFEIGVSATQETKSYVFPIRDGQRYIRLIDTPGVGDTRGIEQDHQNLENVLSFIAELKHLNAICILLRPDQHRLTVAFEFCLKQLFSRLDKSAGRNIVFVFTNSKQTHYLPGATLALLKHMLEKFEGINIPLSKTNIFCTDNEAFRFLAAMKKGVKFGESDLNAFRQSWSHSYKETWKMINYIAGCPMRKIEPLQPHLVKNTISVNEARRLILRLSQPLAEIAQLIEDNILILQRHETTLTNEKESLDKLKDKLFIPRIDLRIVNLPNPVTVCTSLHCSTVHQFGGVKKYEYRTKCHNPCYLVNVPKEIVGAPELTKCSAMAGTITCTVCKCKYNMHQHIYYETHPYETREMDLTIENEMYKKKINQETVNEIVSNINVRLREYQSERDKITNATARFAVFLKTNAIAPYNDAYNEYMEYLIDRERSLGDNADMAQIRNYQKMQKQYTVQKDQVEKAMKMNTPGMSAVTAEDITKSVEMLYNLKHNGPKIIELFSSQSSARQSENKNKVRESVYDMPKKKQNNSNSNTKQQNVQLKGKEGKQTVEQHKQVKLQSEGQIIHITHGQEGSLDITLVNQTEKQPQEHRHRQFSRGNAHPRGRSQSNSSSCSDQGATTRNPNSTYRENYRGANSNYRGNYRGNYQGGPGSNHGIPPLCGPDQFYNKPPYSPPYMPPPYYNEPPPDYRQSQGTRPLGYGYKRGNFNNYGNERGNLGWEADGGYNYNAFDNNHGNYRDFDSTGFDPRQGYMKDFHPNSFNNRHFQNARKPIFYPQNYHSNPNMRNPDSNHKEVYQNQTDTSQNTPHSLAKPRNTRQFKNRGARGNRRFIRPGNRNDSHNGVTAFIASSSSSSDEESDTSAYHSAA